MTRSATPAGTKTAPLFFLGSGCSQYLGAAIAVSLFPLLAPVAMAWARVCIAGIILCIWRRPWRINVHGGGHRWSRRELIASIIFGAVMTAMNLLFYSAIGRIPVGTTVSLEFVGPVSVAVVAGRGWRTRGAALLAAVGVVSIGGLGIDLTQRTQLLGAAFAVAAGATWAGYIVLGQRIAAKRSGIDSLAVGSIFGALIFLPLGLASIFSSPAGSLLSKSGGGRTLLWLFPAVVGVAVLSTVIPYSLEQVALSRLGPDVFALLSSLLPLTSTIVGTLVLAQIPNLGQIIGLICVSLAVALARYTRRPRPRTIDPLRLDPA